MRTHKDETGEWIEKKDSKGATFAGKYLFFSSNWSMLKAIAQQEIALHNFTCATVLFDPDKRRGEYMLCIYDLDNRRERELAMRYANNKGIEYIGWIGKTMEIKEFFRKMCVGKKSFLMDAPCYSIDNLSLLIIIKIQCRSGETGRRRGLKILRASCPCRFNSDLRHQ